MRYKPLLNFLIIGLSSFASSPARAYNEDVHYGATFVLALTLGMKWEQALTVSSANQAVDQSLFTKPTEHAVWKSPTGAKEPSQRNFGPLSLGLSLQDYVFHCFSPEPDTRGERHARVMENLERLEKRADTLIEMSKTSDDAADKSRALVAIGIYLHCQQDSWSHSGYGGNPLGHVYDDLAWKSPDDTSQYPRLTTKALWETAAKLKMFTIRLGRKTTDVSDVELAELFKALTDSDSPDRQTCNRKISEYWLRKIADSHPSVDVPPMARNELAYTYRIKSKVHLFTIDDRGILQQDSPFPEGFVNWKCQLRFQTAFSEIAASYKTTTEHSEGITIVTEWVDPVTLSLLSLPPQRTPSLEVTIFAQPTFSKDNGDYDLFKE
jgi:hypothetical protein